MSDAHGLIATSTWSLLYDDFLSRDVKKNCISNMAVVDALSVCCAGEVWAGRPAKLLRKMEEGEAEFILRSADNYAILAALHAEENAKTFPELEADKARRRRAAARWMLAAAHRSVIGSPQCPYAPHTDPCHTGWHVPSTICITVLG